MSLYIRKDKFKKRRASRDIPVFKVLREGNVSPIFKFHYTPGWMDYKIKLGIHETWGGEIVVDSGFHSYSPEQVMYRRENDNILIESIRVGDKGQIFFETIGQYWDQLGGKILMGYGYIPKGSTYITNDHGHMVSTRIVLVRIVQV